MRSIIGRLLKNYKEENFDHTDLEDEEKELLVSKLGWVGRLLLYPQDSTDESARTALKTEGFRTAVIMTVAMIFAFLALLAGLAVAFVLLAMITVNGIQPKFLNQTGHGFVYIETFAIWIASFFGSQIVIQKMTEWMGREELGLPLSPIAFFGSLIVLVWPVIRGIPFSTVRKDIGWEIRNPFVEAAVGGFSYLALLVPLVIGIGISILIGMGLSTMDTLRDFESTGPAGHPIAEEIASGGWFVGLMVVISACVAAPIVEETMFCGVLYRYLRDVTSRARARWISVAASSLVSGLIFAMVHPQGLIGIPILTTLAIGFCLVREWRNSLIGPMIMHAINNSLVTCLLFSILS